MSELTTSSVTDAAPNKSLAEKARDREVLQFGDFTFHPSSGQLSVVNQSPVNLSQIQNAVLIRIIEGDIDGVHPISESLYVAMRMAGSNAHRIKVVHQTVHRLRKILNQMLPDGDRHIMQEDGIYSLCTEKKGKSVKEISSRGRPRK